MASPTQKSKIIPMLPLLTGDCEYVLEVVAATLRKNGVTKQQALKPLTESAKRLLSISFSDRDIRVSPVTLETEARRIAGRLLAA